MQTTNIEIKGTGMLLQHNVRLANPMDEITKLMAEAHKNMKRSGADKDAIREEIADLEFKGGLYLNKDRQVCIPTRLLFAMIHQGAKLTRGGQTVLRSMTILGDSVPLIHSGPSDFETLFKRRAEFRYQAMVTVGTSKVLRTRPAFQDWSCTFDLAFNPDGLDRQDLIRYVVEAGMFCGLGDGRSKLQAGRYVISKVDGKNYKG